MKEGVEFSDIWRVESFPVKLWKYFPPGGSGTQVKLDKYFKTPYKNKIWLHMLQIYRITKMHEILQAVVCML